VVRQKENYDYPFREGLNDLYFEFFSTLAKKAFVVAERPARLNEPRQLHAGRSVRLLAQQPNADQPEKQGIGTVFVRAPNAAA
jgi:hypothetical protein